MRKDGDAGLGHPADETRDARAAFELHRVRADLEARDGVCHRRVVAALVASEREVRDDERVLHGARDGGRRSAHTMWELR